MEGSDRLGTCLVPASELARRARGAVEGDHRFCRFLFRVVGAPSATRAAPRGRADAARDKLICAGYGNDLVSFHAFHRLNLPSVSAADTDVWMGTRPTYVVLRLRARSLLPRPEVRVARVRSLGSCVCVAHSCLGQRRPGKLGACPTFMMRSRRLAQLSGCRQRCVRSL